MIPIPETFSVGSYLLNTYIVVFVVAIFAGLFVYWHETRRDGFDEEKALDLLFLVMFTSVFYSRFLYGLTQTMPLRELASHVIKFWTPGINIFGFVIGFLLTVVVFTRSWKWSFYRISDIFSISLSLALSIIYLGYALLSGESRLVLYSLGFFLLYLSLTRVRSFFRSGLVFSTFLLAISLVGMTALSGRADLIFYIVLITISIVNFYLRERKNPMKTNLPAGFVSKIKKALKKKEKELVADQQQLIDADPYMTEGRDQDNEYLDDVTEDIQKETTDLRLSAIGDVLMRVRKALAKIKLGKYGICEVCGGSISKERLTAYPEATTCVKHSN